MPNTPGRPRLLAARKECNELSIRIDTLERLLFSSDCLGPEATTTINKRIAVLSLGLASAAKRREIAFRACFPNATYTGSANYLTNL